jgi:membrane protein YqaA with SNARE-associated domain
MNAAAICLTTFGGCLLGSLVPLVNTEILVLSMAAVAPPWLLGPIVALAATGQMLGKIVLYCAGRGTVRLRGARENARVSSLLDRLGSHRGAGGTVLFASASAGLPPLYAMSVACGMVGFGLMRFVGIGLVGRLIRFGLLVQVPHLFAQVVR